LPLAEVETETVFGGKAINLGAAIRAGLPVPPGFGIGHDCVERLVRDDETALAALGEAFAQMKAPIAVRSSAIGEDSEGASFAGQHLSVLNIFDYAQLVAAVHEVVESAAAESAQSYREKLSIDAAAHMGIVLQELVAADSAGVLFTRNPLNHADERVIEAAWGLGEVVVAGLVIPDYYRVSREGEILQRRIGDKDIELKRLPGGGTQEIDVAEDRALAPVLDDNALIELHEMASRCETIYGAGLDIEWAFADGKLSLLQCRAITTSA
jgi:pyruvate,water dikinase